jgi:hypothetical protein
MRIPVKMSHQAASFALPKPPSSCGTGRPHGPPGDALRNVAVTMLVCNARSANMVPRREKVPKQTARSRLHTPMKVFLVLRHTLVGHHKANLRFRQHGQRCSDRAHLCSASASQTCLQLARGAHKPVHRAALAIYR